MNVVTGRLNEKLGNQENNMKKGENTRERKNKKKWKTQEKGKTHKNGRMKRIRAAAVSQVEKWAAQLQASGGIKIWKTSKTTKKLSFHKQKLKIKQMVSTG